jgi:hypothetical protein
MTKTAVLSDTDPDDELPTPSDKQPVVEPSRDDKSNDKASPTQE